MSQYLKDQACFCGRNARMSACLVSLPHTSLKHLTLPTHHQPHPLLIMVDKCYKNVIYDNQVIFLVR